ncbi:hypothetical protein ASF76_13790 [Microbacterium sp. Leaf151]|nr:hypothetical protein ASF76_13790 [Microbacterium sp. Leaf151]
MTVRSERVPVVAAVDGDTFKITTTSGSVGLRIIGIVTPEIGRDGAASECHADQARDELDQLIYGHTVDLFTDPTQAETDKYGRLL